MFENYTMEQVEARLAEIEKELRDNGATADVEKLTEEVKALEARKGEIKAAAEKRKSLLDGIASQRGVAAVAPETPRSNEEVRKSPEYVEAFANYIKTGNDSEARALLTDNTAGGAVPVPAMVEEIVKTAWEKNGITKRVKKTYFRGNIKQGFELSGTGATTRTEGSTTVTKETLVNGIVTLIPKDIAKFVSISREVYALGGEEFLRYIYDELTYRIAKEAAKNLLTKIIACGQTGTTTQVNVGELTATQAGMAVVPKALALLSDQATDPVVMMNKQSWGDMVEAQLANKFNADPFRGLPVEFDNSLPALSAATTGDTWMIVGDLANGAHANFPNGENVHFIFDEITSAASGMVNVHGSQMVAIEPVAPKAFVKVMK